MSEQLEIVIGANVDDAKAGINSLSGTINQFAQQGKLSIGVLEQSLAQLKAQIKVTTDPVEAQKLGQAFKEVQAQINQLKLSDGLAQQLGGVTRAARTAHAELEGMSQSIRGLASGSERGTDVLSNLVFTFERLAGQTGGVKEAFSAIGATLLGPAGIVLAVTTLIPLLGQLAESFLGDSEDTKAFKKEVDDLKKSLDKLKEPINITIQSAIGSTGGQVNELQTLIAQATRVESEAGKETEASIQRRASALVKLKSSYSDLFNDIKTEKSLTESTASAIIEAGNKEIDILKRKAAESATSETVKLAQTTVNTAKQSIDNLNNELDARLKILGTTKEQVKQQIAARDEAVKAAREQASAAPGGFIIPVTTIIAGEKELNEFTKKIQTFATGLAQAKKDLAKNQITQSDIISDQVSNGDFVKKATAAVATGLTEIQRLLIEKAKRDQNLFTIPLSVTIDNDQVQKEQLRLAEIIEKGIRDRFIKIGDQEIPVRLKVVSVDNLVKPPELEFDINSEGIKARISEIAKSIIIPLQAVLDEPTLLESEDRIKRIFSDFGDTAIFTEAGKNAGRKFSDALIKEVEVFQKGFKISPNLNIDDVVSSLKASLEPLQQITLKVLKSEDFKSAITDLERLHDAGIAAGEAAQEAFEKAGFSAEDAAKGAKIIADSFGGITKASADAAEAIASGLGSAVTDLITAFSEGKNPAKAFFNSIVQSLEQVIAKIIEAQIEQLILNTLFKAASAAFNPLSILGLVGLGFAEGGRPEPGKPAIVGEKGWELFIPDQPGTVIPHEKSVQLLNNSVTSSLVKEHESVKEYLIAIKISQQLKEYLSDTFRSIENNVKILATNNDKLASYSYKLHENIESIKESLVSVTLNNNNSIEKIASSFKEYTSSATSTTKSDISSIIYKESFNKVNDLIKETVHLLTNNQQTSTSSDVRKTSLSTISESNVSSAVSKMVEHSNKELFSKVTLAVEKLSTISQLSSSDSSSVDYSSIINNTLDKLKDSVNNKEINNIIDRLKESISNKEINNSITRLSDKVSILNNNNATASIEKIYEKINSTDRSVTIERIINNNFYTDKISHSIKEMSLQQLQHTFNIPAFASGGAVFGPTLAILGEGFGISRSNPEFVGTASQLKGIQGGTLDVNVNVNGELSIQRGALGVAINQEVRSSLRTSGKKPF